MNAKSIEPRQLRWTQRVTVRLHRMLFGCDPTPAQMCQADSGGDGAARTEPWTPFDGYPYKRVIDIPSHLLPCAYDWSDSGLPVRLCDKCTHYWFGIFGPEDRENVGVRGAGDHCACCGDTAIDARAIARERIAAVVIRSILAGATPADVSALVQEAARDAARDAEFVCTRTESVRLRVPTWPQIW